MCSPVTAQSLVLIRAHGGQFVTAKRLNENEKGKESEENKLRQWRDKNKERKSEERTPADTKTTIRGQTSFLKNNAQSHPKQF